MTILAVASGKGGVGKTWLSSTLCHALAQSGKRVLLFDGDLGLANVDIQLGLTVEKDLSQVVEGKLPLAQVITRFAAGGFDIIAGRSGAGSLAHIPASAMTALRQDLQTLAKQYDYVLIDLGAGVEATVRQLSALASTILVVTNDEPTALTDAYAFIKLTPRPGPELKLVVNMAGSPAEGQKTYETLNKVCQNFLKFSLILGGIIRRDTKVRDAIRAQQPLLTRSPNTEAADDVA